MEKNKTILLLHGFKRNGVDDFEQMHEYFDKYSNDFNIVNLTYFENYQKDTLNDKHLNKIVNETVDQLKDQDEVIVLGYSAGAIIASMITSRLPESVKTHIFAMTPPIKIVLAKWVPLILKQSSKQRKLKKKLGKERYASIRQKREENKIAEKHPIAISFYINKVRKKYQKYLLNDENTHYLFANTDYFVNTHKMVKKVSKRNRDYQVKDFRHELLLSTDKQVFIDWFESKLKDYNI